VTDQITRQVSAGVPAAVDEAFPALFAWLGARGVASAGPPFIRTTEVDPGGEPLEIEAAVPVDEAVSGACLLGRTLAGGAGRDSRPLAPGDGVGVPDRRPVSWAS
jgi:hypothetical protein